MPHRRMSHATRRRHIASVRAPVWNGEGSTVPLDWDECSYDDVVPIRLRVTPVLDDDGDPAALTDLIRDDVRVI